MFESVMIAVSMKIFSVKLQFVSIETSKVSLQTLLIVGITLLK
jgi:hypothetical protein